MLMVMDNKTWLVEVALVACIMAWVALAITLLLGHALWVNLTRNQEAFPSWRQMTKVINASHEN
jgi:hypothetical protein